MVQSSRENVNLYTHALLLLLNNRCYTLVIGDFPTNLKKEREYIWVRTRQDKIKNIRKHDIVDIQKTETTPKACSAILYRVERLNIVETFELIHQHFILNT